MPFDFTTKHREQQAHTSVIDSVSSSFIQVPSLMQNGRVFSEQPDLATQAVNTRSKINVGLISLGLLVTLGFTIGFLFW